MRIVQFKIEEQEVVAKQLTFDDWEERLERLGYIKDLNVGDDYEPITFAQIYLAHRRSLHHKSQTLITPGSSQWTLLKKITDEALEFIGVMPEDTGMREGFVFYLKLAEEQDWVSLKDLRYKAKKLIEIYEAEKLLDNDPNQGTTDQLVAEYTKELLKRTGYAPVVKSVIDYLPFIWAAELSIKHRLTPAQYIQFLVEKWEWAGVLKPNQLHGKKTEEYLLDSVGHTSAAQGQLKKIFVKRKGADRYGD